MPISHYETADPPPRKKAKLIKRDFSIAPDENRKPSKKTISAQKKEEQSKTPANDPKTTWNEELPAHPINDDLDSNNNWIEAEIPGLTTEPTAPEKPEEDVPVYKASPKKEYQSDLEKPQESPEQEKPGMKVKNLTPETEEKENSKSKKQAASKSDSPELEIKTSESKPKSVEKKDSVASHKNIDKKEAEAQKPEPSSSYTEEDDTEIAEVPSQQNDEGQDSPERVKVKPFLLDVRYLEQEESDDDSSGKLSADQVDAAIARLNALQVDLENQLVSIPGELIAKKKPANENMRKDRIQGSLPDLEGTVNESHDPKEVSLEELDSFLFTATQRKNKE